MAPAVGASGPEFDRTHIYTDQNLVDLIDTIPGDFDRCIGQDKFLEFELQLIKIPLTLFTQPIDRKAQQTLLLLRQVIDAYARRDFDAQQLRSLDRHLTVDYFVVLANQNRHAEPQGADRWSMTSAPTSVASASGGLPLEFPMLSATVARSMLDCPRFDRTPA